MTQKGYRDKETLERLYHEEGMTQQEIGDKFGCAQTTVKRWMDKHGVEPREKTEAMICDDRLLDEEWLRQEYTEKERTTVDLAKEIGCATATIFAALDRFDIEYHDPGIGRRKTHPTFFQKDGYERVASSKYVDGKARQDRAGLHRLLAVAKYGFEEVHDLDVHHKNGIPWDNRPDNIEIMTRSEHMKLHHEKERLQEAEQ